MPAAVPVEERLFSLVLALLATEHGLTKSEILATVQGYRQRYAAGGDNSALERQFERDKDDIRELGVPLETIEQPGDPGNNQNLRYRIPRGSYDLPTDITFSREEATLLGLAAMVWREGSLSAESRRALLKLRSIGVTSDEPVLGYQPRSRARDAAFEPIRSAIDKNVVVRFAYLKPGDAAAREREVEPLALVQFDGRWIAHSRERGTGEPKNFLLSRIVGDVTLTRSSFERPEGDQASAALRQLEDFWRAHTARVRLQPESDAATRLAKRREATLDADGVLSLHYADLALLADELASFGPEVVVLDPPELRRAVIERLERTVRDHG